MTRRSRYWLFAFVLIGLGASLASLYIRDRLLRDVTYSSFCNLSPLFSCDAAYRSRFGAFLGVPVALVSTLWFTLALLLTLAPFDGARPRQEESGAAAYLFLASMPAISVVLFLAYASLILRVVCILCALISLAVLGVFVISGAAPGAGLAGLPRRAVRDARALAASPMALGVAVLFLAAAASAVAFFPRRPAGDTAAALAAVLAYHPSDFDIAFEENRRVPIPLPSDGAKVLIVTFTDYQCTVCAEDYRTSRSVLARYDLAQPGTIKVVRKDYPLDPECNPNMNKGAEAVHQAACEAAVAVRLAERQHRGPAMEEWLYAHQGELTPAAVRQAAKDVGRVDDFDGEFQRVLASIKSDIDLARQLDVRAMPTLFVNGVRIEGGLKPGFLDQAIAHELRVSAVQ